MLDRFLILPKASYFFFFAAAAVITPFLALYYQTLGLSGREIGLLIGLTPLITLFAAPLLSGMADASRRHHAFLVVSVGGAGVMVWLLGKADGFVQLLVITSAFAVMIAVIIPIIDSTVLSLVAGRSQDYGEQRIFGAVGWGSAAAITGLIMDARGVSVIFPAFCLLFAGLFIVSVRLPVQQTELAQPFWRGLRKLLRNRRLVIFLAVAFIAGMALSVILNFLFLHLADMGATRSLMGLSQIGTTISEMPVWLVAERMQARWGRRTLLLLALGATAVRLFAYAYMTVPWLVLPISLLHGPVFAILWTTGVSTMKELAPPGMNATAQGLFSGVFVGLGSATGSFVGGWLLDSLGTGRLFFWMGVIVSVTFLFVWSTGRFWLAPPAVVTGRR